MLSHVFIYYVLHSIGIMNLKSYAVINFSKSESTKFIEEKVAYWLMLPKFLSKKSVAIGIRGFVIS